MSKSTDEQEHLTDQLHQLEEYSSMIFKSDVASEEENQYCVLTASEVVTHMNDYVDSVNKIIMSTPTITRILLNHCKWDKSALLDKFCTDLDKLYEEAHVKDPSEFQNDSPTKKDCEICLLECESTTTINCGHSFCSTCWSEYLKTKIMDEGIATSISCAATGCEAIINDETVIQLVDDDEAKKRYERIIINSFVQKSPCWRWCPAPECEYVIQFYYTPYKPMLCHCKCDHEFCFVCGEEFHAPITCELLRKFQKYLIERERRNEARQRAERNMIEEYEQEIKNCPNPACNISIQKGFGCPAMKCKICLTYFCWYCLKSFKSELGIYSHKCKNIPSWVNEADGTPFKRLTAARLSKEINRVKNLMAGIRTENYDSDETSGESIGDNENKLQEVLNLTKMYEEVVMEFLQTYSDDRHQSISKETGKKRSESHSEVLSKEKRRRADDSEQSTSKEFGKKLGHSLSERRSKKKKLFVADSEKSTSKKTAKKPSEQSSEDEPSYPVIKLDYDDDNNNYFRKYRSGDLIIKRCIEKYVFIKMIISTLSDDSPTLDKLKLASRDLMRCLRLIKYTAIFAIYLKTVHQPLIFKSLFRDLKEATGKLNFFMEKIQLYENDHHPNIPNELFTVHRNCQLRYKALVDFVDNGYDNGLWTFKSKVEI